ncbi:MAG: DUF4405 domain-containing protein [Bacteroidales bacterium]|jgi:hypothetical protein|nr:DUF4405 domain-containing protein [Bacteroidales bacterium]
MNKIIAILLFVLIGNFAGNSQIHCPYGGTVDCYGECGLFTDNNGDVFCDYGKLSKEIESTASATDEPAAATQSAAKISTVSTDSSTPSATLAYSETQEYDQLSAEILQQPDNEVISMQQPEQIQSIPPVEAPYHLFELSIALLFFYLISVLLAKYRIYRLATHRKIWNIGLAVSFLISCIIGLMLAYYVNVRNFPSNYRSLVLYHVEFGIAMTVIALFHMIWHWRYFLNLLKSKKQKTGKQKKE